MQSRSVVGIKKNSFVVIQPLQDFIRNDNVRVLGENVIVMFSHQRRWLGPRKFTYKPRESRRDVDYSPISVRGGDLRAKINNNQDRKWSDLIS